MKWIPFSFTGVLMLVLSGCNGVHSDLTEGIRFYNNLDKKVVLLAMDEELAHVIDLLGYMEIAEDDNRIMHPGEKRKLALSDIEGDYNSNKNLYIFTYSDEPDYQREQENGDTYIFYHDHFRIFSYHELLENDFNILISDIKTNY